MEKRKLFKNSIYNIIYKGLNAIFPLITTAYISRTLLPEGVGKVSYANTIASYFVFLAALGIPNYGVKQIAKSIDNKKNTSKTFFELLIINGISTTICLFIYYLIVNNTSLFIDKIDLMNVMGLMIVLNLFNIDWFYQGAEEYGYIAIRSIVIKIACLLLMFIFVRNSNDFIVYAIILCIGTAGNNLLNCIYIKKFVSFETNELNIKNHLAPIFILLATAIATEVYTMLDTVMLEHYHGDTVVGYYTNAVKIVRMIYTVDVAMLAPFFPRLSNYYSKNNLFEIDKLLSLGTKIILAICIPSIIGLIGLSDYTVLFLFGNLFLPSGHILKILSILVLVFSLAYFLGHIVLMSTNKEKIILKATVFGAITNIVFNTLLIPRLEGSGAALASVASEIVVTFIMLYHSRRMFRLDINFKYILSIFSSSFFMLILLICLKSFLSYSVINLMIIICLCFVFYVFLLYVTKNEIFTWLCSCIKEKRLK